MEVDSQDISSDRVVVSIVETEGTRARPRTSFSSIVLLEIIGVGGSRVVAVIPVDSLGVSSSVS
jgi:hypothetical protein